MSCSLWFTKDTWFTLDFKKSIFWNFGKESVVEIVSKAIQRGFERV